MRWIWVLSVLLMGACSHKNEGPLFAFKDPQTELYGFKNKSGAIVIPSQFSMPWEIENEQGQREYFSKSSPYDDEFLVEVMKNGHFYRITRDGKIKFESVLCDNGADYYEEGLARFIDEHRKVGFHDRKGNIIIKPEYDYASSFRNKSSFVCNGCSLEFKNKLKFAPIGSSFELAIIEPEHWRYLGDFRGGKWGVIDHSGRKIVPLSYASQKEAGEALKKIFNSE